MRRLADHLEVAPNSIYSHFSDKASLLEALIDSLLVDVPVPDPDRVEWREGVVELMIATRRLLLDHADLIPIFMAGPSRGPNAIRLGEVTLELLAHGGVEGTAAVEALRILLVYSFGFAAFEAPRRADPAPEHRRIRSEEAFAGSEDAPRSRVLAPELARHPTEATFEKGLRWLIDGVTAQAGRVGSAR